MRADLAPFGVDLLLALAGLGILVAVGCVPRRPSALLAALGLGYLTGAAVVPLALIAMLVVGIPFTLETFAAVVFACVGLGAWRWRQAPSDPPPPARPWWRRSPRSWPVDAWVAVAFAALVAAFFAVGMSTALTMPLSEWDAWSIWARKAQMLTGHDTLVTGFFASDSYVWIHQDYPLQVPIWEALHFRAAGGFETQALLRHFWLFLPAFVWAVAFLLRERVRPLVWGPLLLLAAATPGIWEQLLSGYADLPMAIFAMLGAISLGLWLSGGSGRQLALAAIMLAAAAGTKNEGLMAAVALLAVAAAVARSRGLSIRPLALAAGAVAVAILPWRIWTEAHGIEGDLPVLRGLDPVFLLDRLDRVWPAVEAIGQEVSDPGRWAYLLPLAVLAIAASLASGVARRVAVFYLGSLAVAAAGLVWSYWISPNPIDWHLATSATRVVSVLVLIGLAALVHLSGALLNALTQHRLASPARDA